MRDLRDLGTEHRAMFKSALDDFIDDLTNIEEGKANDFRRSLRVKPMKGVDGIWEMTWEGNDGRATFQHGPEQKPGKRHIVWRRIGTHSIFKNP